MPAIFNRTLATDSSSVWPWPSWIADALVINLGTNDGSAATDPKYHYVQTYTDLVKQASAHYGPNLNVFLACGPMSTSYVSSLGNTICFGTGGFFGGFHPILLRGLPPVLGDDVHYRADFYFYLIGAAFGPS